MNSIVPLAIPTNEPVRAYGPGSPEKASLKRRLEEMLRDTVEVPLIIGGREVRTGDTAQAVCPHDHGHVLATFHQAGAPEVNAAAEAAQKAWRDWSETSWETRAAVLMRAADLLAGPWRDTLNGATMLNQSKTAHQAEIDAACELIDFWRFNPYFMQVIYQAQPWSHAGVWNRVDYRPLEGFVFAVTPFNFTSIGGNLPTSPAVMGNTVLWKPASTAVLSGYYIMKILQEAGLPDGVINFLPGRANKVGDPVLAHPDLGGIHFTGSTPVFQGMWKTLGDNIAQYRSYPRIVGETGGKNFVFVHPSADRDHGGHGDRARRLRIPGPEVLGGLARLRAALPVVGGAAGPGRPGRQHPHGRRRPISATSWRRSSIRGPTTGSSATSTSPRIPPTRRSWWAAVATTRRAISSSRRWW